MAGRPFKLYPPLKCPITLTTEDGTVIPFGETLVLCPICHSPLVGLYGTQTLKTGVWLKFQCKNKHCPALQYLKKGKQFSLQTSAFFQDALANHLTQLLAPLLRGDTTQVALAQQAHRSPALMTYIRHKVETILDQRHDLEKLVLKAPLDDAVSLDEMFLTIEGHPIYIIMATSYGKKKVLGIKVAESRDETVMRTVFDEAERNNGKPFSIITIDAWGGSLKMAKDLGRTMAVVIHKHKSPYDKAVIWKIEYLYEKPSERKSEPAEQNLEPTEQKPEPVEQRFEPAEQKPEPAEQKPIKRIIHKIGVKTDFFKYRRKRKYFYLKEEEDLTIPPPKKRGRPKGTKNGHGKGPYKKVPKKDQKKRGPKGVFIVFDKGKKGYAKIDPGKKRVKLAKGGSTTVEAVLNQVIQIYPKMTIQNNLAENKNSVVEHRVWLAGPKDMDRIETRLRTFLFYLNNPEELKCVPIKHRLRGDLLYKELESGLYGHIFRANYEYEHQVGKMEGMN